MGIHAGFPTRDFAIARENLAQTILSVEKGVLALDVSIRPVKDRIDEPARAGSGPIPGAGEAEQVMEQRKMLLGVILGAMKSAAAQRVGTP